MVLACESIFSRTSLDARPRNLHTFSKVNLKYTKCTFPVGQARCSCHLPHSYNLQILLARGNGTSTNVEPWNRTSVFVFSSNMHTTLEICIIHKLFSELSKQQPGHVLRVRLSINGLMWNLIIIMSLCAERIFYNT